MVIDLGLIVLYITFWYSSFPCSFSIVSALAIVEITDDLLPNGSPTNINLSKCDIAK